MVSVKLSELRKAGLELIEAVFQRDLGNACIDCQERPGENKPRKVVLTWELWPRTNERGICEHVLMNVTSQLTVPRTNPTGTLTMVPHVQGELFIRADSLGEPAQTTFADPDTNEGVAQ